MTVVLTLAATAMAFVTSGGDLLTAAISLPLIATASFWSLRLSRWITSKIAPPRPARAAPPPTAPTSARPDHARRRRSRRKRGRRG